MSRHAHVAAAALVAAAAGCGGADAPSTGASALPRGSQPVELDPRDFSADIDHPYWPMAPGTRWTYRETDEEGSRQTVVVTVTGATRRIANGIIARVVRDTVTERGQLVEDTFDWYAQDREGNVWYLGEETAEFENEELVTRAGSFEAGVDGALAGIIMPADPRDGMRYRQEYYAGEAEDSGEVLATGETVQVAFGRFSDAVLTKDTNALEPEVNEYKLYARAVGPVLALGVSGGPGSREELLHVDRAGRRETERAGTAPLGRPPG